MKRRISRLLKIAAVTVLALALVFGLLQTPPVKSFIAAAVSRALSLSGQTEVRVGRITGGDSQLTRLMQSGVVGRPNQG